MKEFDRVEPLVSLREHRDDCLKELTHVSSVLAIFGLLGHFEIEKSSEIAFCQIGVLSGFTEENVLRAIELVEGMGSVGEQLTQKLTFLETECLQQKLEIQALRSELAASVARLAKKKKRRRKDRG